MKKNFKKWTALFLSVAMVAVSGVTTNTSFHAAEDTGVQESAADSDTETGTAADATSATSATSATGENGTEATQEVALTQDATDETAEADNAAATSAASSSSVSDSTETASSDSEATEEVTSSSSSDENKEQVKSEQEQIDDALKDATKRSYHYEDSNITVNAELEDPTAIPDEAEFKVTQITSNTAGYNYDAYMEALNEDAASDTNAKSVNADSKDSEDSDETESTDAYTSDNTLLYDMAFIYTVDVQNEDGNISKKEVEVQPAEGAVTINVEFKKNQLSNEIGAEVNDDVTVGHLPLKDSVKEDLSTTEEATNISANDIDVDKMTDATVSVENQTVTFDAENFSVYFFQNNNGVNRKYIWEGKRDFSFDEIANKIGDLSDYAIVANELDTGDHIEGNVRVGTWSGNISNGSKLNQDIRFTTNTTYDRITVTKTIENNDEQSVDFQFGTFEKENSTLKLIESFQITTQKGFGTIQLTSDEYPKTFTELNNGKAIYIYEIDSNNNPIQENGNIGNYTVKHYSYSNNEDRIENGGGLDNYIGHFNPNNNVLDWDFGGFVQTKEQGKIVLGDEVDNDNGTAVIKGTNTSGNLFVIKIAKAYDSIIKDSNLSSKISSEIASMQVYSSELADAKYGPVRESGGLNVINLKTSKKESEQSGDFKADLGAANFINNNNGNFISDMDNQYLLINIDCGNAKKYSFNTQDLKIDNDGLNIGWTSILANRIIVNFVRRSGNGYVPYDGEVDINGNTTCTIFAPGANVIQTGLFAGEIIANRVSHSGSEIHKYPINITTHKAINVNVVNEKKSNSVSIHGQKTINGEAVKTGLKDKFTFTLTQVDEKGVAVKGGKQLTAKTAADGTFSFDEITYQLKDAGKTYYYQIDEPTVPAGYTKHFEAPIVKVDVQDNGDGNLKVTSNMPDGGYTLDNTYKAEGSITVGGQKTINGEAVKTGLKDKFTFTLTQVDEKGVAVKGGKQLTAKTAADGTFSFGELTYQLEDAGKTYYYQIDEPTVPAGYTKHFEAPIVKVDVQDNGDGNLKVTSNMPDGGYTLDNTYKAEGSITVGGQKTINGEAVKTGLKDKFTFTLTQVDEKGVAVKGGKQLTAKTAADGTFSFDEITYQLKDAGKTYYYQLDETSIPEGYTKNFTTKTVSVQVNDNGDGTLGVTSSMPDGGYTLDNTYKAAGSTEIRGKKTVNGEAVKTGLENKFTFTLTQIDEKGAVVEGGKKLTAQTAADGTFSFGELTYQLEDAGKTYYYQIDEPTVPAGYTKHFKAPIVKVDVQDNGDGNLKVTSNMPDGGYTLDNTYKAEGSITVGGQKTVNGEAVKTGLEDKFTFTLTQVDEKGVAVKGGKQLTAKTAADGTFSFDEITYQLKDAGKTYYYQLDETSIPEDYTKNFTTKTVSVQVNDNGDGTLGVTSSMPDGGYTLDNTYKAAGSTEIRGKKTVNGEAVKTGLENKFTFTLTQIDEKGAVVEGGKKLTAQTAADGTFSFGELTYQLEDAGKTYYYQIDEPTVPAGYTKHFEAPIVKVDVQDNGDGKLKVTNNMPENGYTLDNTYTAGSVIISGTKFLTGSPMTAGQFYFDLYDAGGKKIDTATNDESGAFSFARLEFGQEDIGKTFNYTVREQHAGEVIDGIRYADDVIPVRVTVSAGDGGNIIAAASGSADFTNTQLASLTVNKTWNDNDNADGNRPDSVHVSILKDGEVVRQGDLSETTGWSMTFEGLEPGESYTVEESFDSEYYKAEQNDITVDLNGTDNEVTLVNDYIHPTVDIVANKVLVGGKLQSGQFTFQLYRNSDPNTVVATRVNDASGQIVFNDIEYDEAGYTVREVTGTDTHITYDTGAVTYDADGNVTGSHTEFTNTERPIVLRVQKRSKTAPYDPLEGATYGLYQVVEGGNDILVESEVSDENGYMYYSNIQPGVIYYFKEIAAPTGHEVDPYAGQKFQIKYTNDGQIALYDVDGNPTTLGDITSQNSNELLVQHTDAKSTIDTTSALSYSDDTIVAAAKAVNGAFDEGTTLKVTQLTGSAAKSAAAAVEDATGEIKNNVAYYDVQFIDKDGNEVEPKAGDVTVTIQYKDSLSLPEGTDASALKLVHITDGNAVEAVAGSIAAGNGKLLEAKITSDSFSTFGVVEPGKSNTLGSNYLVTAAGVSDQVSELNISKLDTAGKYVKGARLQIIEKATGKVVAEWNTSDGPMSFARWFDGAGTEPMNVDTYYILHEVSAPDGYQLADDIMFIINKYDSSITIYKYDDAGNLVVDQEAVDQWVSDTTLSMVDVPVEYRNKVRYVQKTIHNEKTIQGDNKVVEVTSVRAVKTGDTTPIALFVIMLAAAAVVLMVLAYRKKKQDNQ